MESGRATKKKIILYITDKKQSYERKNKRRRKKQAFGRFWPDSFFRSRNRKRNRFGTN